ncbi:class I SAM-dependent methyltransferase [candidate division KSB1 bacterium]|nr:class I SAM-dependent methyltransferase [candidate division KSB1 bacterium]
MKLRFEKTMQYTHPVVGKTVLDVGCGPGHYSIRLARNGAGAVTGIDFSEEMIGIAQKKAKENNLNDICSFVVNDVFEYQPEKKFDYTVVMGVMDYIDNPEDMIKRIIELTRLKAFFSFPKAGGVLAWQRKLRYRERCPLYLYTRNELEELFSKFKSHHYLIEKISRDFFVTLTI